MKDIFKKNLYFADAEEFFAQNDHANNVKLSKRLLYLLLAIPVMAILSYAGFFEINMVEMSVCVVVGLLGTASPFVAMKLGLGDRALKYYIMISISLMICMYGVYPSVGVYITLILGVLVSLIYFDPSLTLFVCIMDYLLMLVGRGFRLYAEGNYLSFSSDLFHKWFAHCAGYTIEFLIICPLAYNIAVICRTHMNREYELLKKIDREHYLYELSMGCSKDVIYEYDIQKDVLCCYGYPFLENSKCDDITANNGNYISEKFLSRIQNENIIHPEDVSKIEELIKGLRSDIQQIRLFSGDDYEWLEVESNMIYNDTVATKIIGKIRNITHQKNDEQLWVGTSKSDSLLGVFNRTIGIKLLEKTIDEAVSTDYMTLLYYKIINQQDISQRFGDVFLEAVILRFSEILKNELSEGDLIIRYSKCGFLLYLPNRNPAAIQQLVSRIKDAADNIYMGSDRSERIRVNSYIYKSLTDFYGSVPEYSEEELCVNTDSDEMISFAFRLLEGTKDFDLAMDLLMDRVGTRYLLTYIRAYKVTSEQDVYKCMYEWMSKDAIAEAIDSRLGADIKLADIDKPNETYICECKQIGETGGGFVFRGPLLDSVDRNSIIEVLNGFAKLCATFIGRNNADLANRAKSDFLSSMSHEIRTPMNAIAGFSELILQEDAEDRVIRYANNIKVSANNLLGIINDILDLSKIEAGKFKIVPDEYYLHDIAEEVRNIINVQLDKSSVKLVTSFANNIPDGLVGDGLRIRQILINLLNNSVKFTKEGEVGLEVSWMPRSENSGVLTCIVWDTGAGIKEDEIDKIFSAYEQADMKKNHGIRGTGLGLAITKELIEMMDGSIRIESVYGQGTKMIFELPQGVFDERNYDYEANLKVRPRTEASGIPFTAPWARILVVDDNKVNLEVAAGLLGKYKVQVLTANSGLEAMSVLEQDTDFDIIFMDHIMPDMDGIETTGAIRGMGNPVLEKIPVVMLTANAIKGVEEQYYKAGINGFLSKPISLKELAEIMEQFIPEIKREK